MNRLRRWLVAVPLLLVACGVTRLGLPPLETRAGTVASTDGVPIRYLEAGSGETAVVFLHGWLGSASVWESAMAHLARDYRVVALDLAGHGASGRDRAAWSTEQFASDVVAVADALALRRMVIVGHSMSGPISVAAANRLGERVVGLVPVDTLLDVEWDLPPEVWEEFFGGLRADFPTSVDKFFREALASPNSPKDVIDMIVARARLADPRIAVPMLQGGREFDLKGALRALRAPIRAINSDMHAAKLEVNRKYAPRFDALTLAGVGHWPHLEDPQRFHRALEQCLEVLAR